MRQYLSCKNAGWLVGTLVLIFGQAPSLTAQTSNSPTPESLTATASQRFKNIQVLKDIPADQLIPSMQFITASLGVECGFCHVENHFDQDDKKPKLIARKMMQMMMAINQNNFDGHRQVTCNTCHRGSRMPSAIPAIGEAAGARIPGPDEAALPANLPGAAELINKYVGAMGGAQAISKISTRTEKGMASFAGHEFQVDVFDKSPDKQVSLMHFPNGDSVTVFDGEQGWTGAPGRPPHEMPISEIQGAKIDADLQFPLHLAQLFPDLKPARPESIDGHEAYQLISETNGQPRIHLYFDEQSGLLVRMTRYADSALGLNPVRVDYGDYRAVDGVQVPYRRTVARPSGQFTIQATDIKQNVAVDDAKFAKPQGPAESKP